MATATETIELHEREPVDVPKDDRSDTAIVGEQQTWKVPSINKYRVPVTFWSLAVRIRKHTQRTSIYDLCDRSLLYDSCCAISSLYSQLANRLDP